MGFLYLELGKCFCITDFLRVGLAWINQHILLIETVTTNLLKKQFFNLKIDQNCDPKNAWNFLNEAIGKNNKPSSNISNVNKNGKLLTEPIEIADCFNDYFSNIADKIVENIPPTTANFRDIIPSYQHDDFEFKSIDQ